MHATSTLRSRTLARFPRVYPIVDTAHLESVGVSPARMAEALAGCGFRIVQYRHKGPFTRQRFAEAQAIAAICRSAGACFVVNDRADMALALGADGVHVGQEDLFPSTVRRLVGPDVMLGFSTHNAEQLAADECRWADYLAIGPVFGTVSKRNPDPVVGIGGVRQARSAADKPLVAIGGIGLESASDVLGAGADSVAVISGMGLENLAAWAPLDR